MKTYDVQTVSLDVASDAAFDYVADPANLPEWTSAFRSVSPGKAVLETPQGAADISLVVTASREHGTIDWSMEFSDGSVARAHSRVIPHGDGRSAYIFFLPAPPVPLERLEGALEEQSRILREELARLGEILSRRAKRALA
jgi:hypothetical protein